MSSFTSYINGHVKQSSTQVLEVFNKATCFECSGQQQANTCNIRHTTEKQNAMLFGN